MFTLNPFKSTKQAQAEPTWNPNTLTMEQPSQPAAPIVSQQPPAQEQMEMRLRGGADSGEVCCAVCAGAACFECLCGSSNNRSFR